VNVSLDNRHTFCFIQMFYGLYIGSPLVAGNKLVVLVGHNFFTWKLGIIIGICRNWGFIRKILLFHDKLTVTCSRIGTHVLLLTWQTTLFTAKLLNNEYYLEIIYDLIFVFKFILRIKINAKYSSSKRCQIGILGTRLNVML